MATTTTNLGLTKPALSESADVGVINDNSDKIDVEAGKSRANFAATYSASSAYAVGDYCERGGNLYRCTTAIGSGGEAWNSGHWTQVAVTGEIPKVIDNLTSTSTVNALSAKQGKVLDNEIGAVSDEITSSGISKDIKGSTTPNSSNQFSVTFPSTSLNMLAFGSDGGSRIFAGLVYATSNSISMGEMFKGSNVSFTTSGRVVTFTLNNASEVYYRVINIKGNAPTF